MPNKGCEPVRLELGARIPRADGLSKVTGTEPYAVDLYPPNPLWAGAKRAGIPHGLIRGIDNARARSLPGVMRILTSADVPGSNRHGIIHQDMPVLADGKVRHGGDAVALVIAESRAALRQALEAIIVQIDPLPIVAGIDDALDPQSPKVHEERPEGNILVHARIERGKVDQAFESCAAEVSEVFVTPVQAHLFLETENGLAFLAEDGTLEIIASTQAPFRDRFEISRALSIPFEKIRVKAPYLGGGFGGKDGATVQCLLALAALAVPLRWIKMVWEREESMLAGYKRHATRLHYRAGALEDGTLYALDCRLFYDTGAYAHLGGEVLELGMEHAAGPYRIPHARVEGWCLYTNNPIAGAMRAFGVCQVAFAIEQVIDLLAEKLHIDPLDFRLRNALRSGDENLSSLPAADSTGMQACLRQIADHPLWTGRENWKSSASAHTRRGVGIASVFNAMGYGKNVRDSAIARIELMTSGEFMVTSAVADMGQGNASTYAQIAGSILHQNEGQVHVTQPDTAHAYPSGSSSAGRTTYTFGNALFQAAHELRNRILNRGGMMLFTEDDRHLELRPGCIRHAPSGRELPLSRLASLMRPEERVSLAHFVAPVVEPKPGTYEGLRIGFPHLLYAYGAHLAAIEVDLLSGAISVLHYVAVTDGGTVLNPTLFEQQIEGGIAQGMGFALLEDLLIRQGIILNPDLSTYLIPTSLDLPTMETSWVNGSDNSGPLGMKGVGEVAMNGPLPAIANAFAHATGRRIFQGPLHAERVFWTLAGSQCDQEEKR